MSTDLIATNQGPVQAVTVNKLRSEYIHITAMDTKAGTLYSATHLPTGHSVAKAWSKKICSKMGRIFLDRFPDLVKAQTVAKFTKHRDYPAATKLLREMYKIESENSISEALSLLKFI